MTRWIAALPMYNVTPEHGALWRALLSETLETFSRSTGPRHVDILDETPDELMTLWSRPDLLLSQTCGLPYRMLGLQDTTHLIATPVFDVEDCEGPNYRSHIAVSAAAWARGATTLDACRGLRAVYNGMDSHSGMNALRHTVAPLSRDGRFFSSVRPTGSHHNSLMALAAGEADMAAIDCITYALLQDAGADALRGVKLIGRTAAAPGLPFIASRTLDERHCTALFDALEHARRADAQRARTLLLREFVRPAPGDYAEIERMARSAEELGYPVLG